MLSPPQYTARVKTLYILSRGSVGEILFACQTFDRALCFARDHSDLASGQVAGHLLDNIKTRAVEAVLAFAASESGSLPRWARTVAAQTPTNEILLRAARRHKDGMAIPEAMLTQLLNSAPEQSVKSWLEEALGQVNGLAALHVLVDVEPMLAAVFNMAKAGAVAAYVAGACRVSTQANLAARETGNLASLPSFFTPLLRHTPLSPALDAILMKEAYGSDPRSQRAREGVDLVRRKVHESTSRLAQVLQELFRAVLKRGGEDREAALGWLASVVRVSEVRLRIKDHTSAPMIMRSIADGHGAAINFSCLLLLLTEPFVRQRDKLAGVDPRYWELSQRLVCEKDARIETVLRAKKEEEDAAVKQLMESEGVDEMAARELHAALMLSLSVSTVTPANGGASSGGGASGGEGGDKLGEGQFNLVTEMFFIALRALHVCYLPAVDGFVSHMQSLHHHMAGLQPGTPDHTTRDVQLLLAHDRWDMALYDPALVDAVTQFYLAVAYWVHTRLESSSSGGGGSGEEGLQGVPEFIVKDIATWISHISRSQPRFMRPPSVQGPILRPLVAMAASLLHRPTLFPSPIVTAKLIAMLRALIETGGDPGNPSTSPAARDGPWAYEVLEHPLAQQHLAPAIMHAYVAVDMVEGLDVDKEDFDKYSVKHDMAILLKRLWVVPPHRVSMLGVSHASKQDFAKSMLEMLLFVSGGAFDSVREIRVYERLKANGAAWQAKLVETKGEVERNFTKKLAQVPHSLAQTMDSLTALTDLLSEPAMCHVLCSPRLVRLTSSLVTHFMAKLAGPQRSDFDIEHVATVRFDPRGLLVQIGVLCTRLLVHGPDSIALLAALAEDVEYSDAVGQTYVDIVCGGEARTMLMSPDQLDLLSGLPAQIASTRYAEGAAVAMETNTPLTTTSATITASSSTLPSHSLSSSSTATAPTSIVTSLSTSSPSSVSLAGASSGEEGERVYVEVMRPHVFGICSFRAGAQRMEGAGGGGDESEDDEEEEEKGEYEHEFRALIATSRGSKAKTNKLIKETKEIGEMLPLHRDAAIFVRHDSSRLDVLRAVVTGPPGTPYAQGCFVFDLFCPDDYPRVPPLVKLCTTGGGKVRFNPNLYNDGKVCLSLLGTFHGGDASQKWDPAQSSLYQVLVSIQGMILVEQPIYNEPGTEGQGTAEGDRRSSEYNAPIREATMKFAILDVLMHPPHGLEDVVRTHFRLNKVSVLRVCDGWVAEAPPHARERMAHVREKIAAEIAKL